MVTVVVDMSYFLQEVMRWANRHLNRAGLTDHLITDLTFDMADGVTLLQLVQSLCQCLRLNQNIV